MISPYNVKSINMKPSKSDKDSLERFARKGLVQFRADPVLMQGLTQIAEKFHMPVGALARLWVAERLVNEMSHDISALEQWRSWRYAEIEKVVQAEFKPVPVLVMHLVPFSKYIDLDPSAIKQLVRMLPPVESTEGFSARINLEGFRTEKRHLSEESIADYIQIFREGPIESVREIMTDENNGIIGELFDEEFISAVWSYSCALEAMGIQLPLALFVRMMNTNGVSIRSAKQQTYSNRMTYGAFDLKGISINSWNEVLKIENAAKTAKGILDKIANSAGLPGSLSYSPDGKWIKSSDREPKVKKQIEKIELSGFGDLTDFIEIKAKFQNTELVLGRVRPPALEITPKTHFKCFVKQKDLSNGAQQFLDINFLTKQLAEFTIGDYKFKGFISKQPMPGMGGGAFDGINIPQNLTLTYEIEQV